MHLQAREPFTLALAADFFKHIARHAEALYILGDFVEYWIGDDAYDGSLEQVLVPLRELPKSGTRTYLMHGNRDFLFGPQFALDNHLELIATDYRVIDSHDQSLVLMHGDTLCTDDQDYMNVRQTLRNPEWQQAFLARSIADRVDTAKQLRQQSETATAGKSDAITDVNPNEVVELLQKLNLTCLLHGHTHRPNVHDLQLTDGRSAKRYVLGDWGTSSAVYAKLTDQGLELNDWLAQRTALNSD